MTKALLVALAGFALVACSQSSDRDFARYYDESGLFTMNLPEAHVITVTPPQAGPDGPELLGGVISQAPAPSPEAQPAFGGGFQTATAEPDQTIYEAFAISTAGFADLSEMGLYFLTGDPAIDLQVEEPIRLDGHPGTLIVADVEREGTITASIAAAITLGSDGTGFLIAAIFPAGDWDAQRVDFEEVLDSFRSEVPPALETVPVGAEVS